MNKSIRKNKYMSYSKVYLLFYLIYVILITISHLTAYASYLQYVYKVTFIMSIIINLVFMSFIRNKYGEKSNWDYILIVSFVIILFLMSFLHIAIMTYSFISVCLFIINLKYINIKNFLKIDLGTKSFLMVSIFLLYLLKLTPDTTITYRHGIMQMSGGFGNHNGFAGFIFSILLSYIAIKGRKIFYIKNIILVISIVLITFLVTDSQGFVIAGLVLLLLLLIGQFMTINNLGIIKRLVEYILLILVIIISFISVLIPIYMSSENPLFSKLNTLLTNRLLLQHITTIFYPIKLTGYDNSQVLNWMKFYNNDNSVYIDNTYLALILFSGIIGFIIFEAILIKACYISVYYDNYVLSSLIVSLSLFFVIESGTSSIYIPIICAYIINYTHKMHMSRKPIGINRKVLKIK